MDFFELGAKVGIGVMPWQIEKVVGFGTKVLSVIKVMRAFPGNEEID